MRSVLLFIVLWCYASISLADGVPPGCGTPVKTCVSPGGTKSFAGVPVTLPCWQYHEQYTCGVAPVDTCKTLPGTCHPSSAARCTAQIEGQCVKANYTYECPTQKCDQHSFYCASDVFCIDGKCVKQTPTQNKDFGKDASELAVVAKGAKDAASQQNNQQAIHLFTGHKAECSVAVAGFGDCCKDSGWGKDASLMNCSDDEKKLGKDKEHYLVHYIGDYCHNETLGICTSTHKVYCVFDSKMARIVEEYGRSQLGKSFGGPQSADCNGLSLDEFQKLNFDTMNFINPAYFYPGGAATKAAGIAGDMAVNGPSSSDMANAINKRIHDDIDNNTPSADKRNDVDTKGLAKALASQAGRAG